MAGACGHPLCERIGGACSLATTRSRGCRPGAWTTATAPEVFDEVRALLVAIARDRTPRAAARLAQLVRAEALEGRNLLAQARAHEPELAAALAPLLGHRLASP